MTAESHSGPVTLNPFTASLLNYSADRDDSIGRPERWGRPPPLMVDESQLHVEMDALADELWAGPSVPIWYFLIGGPGNGKSEAVGALIRKLNVLRGGGRSLIDDATTSGSGRVRYAYHCKPKPNVSIVLVQDISVPKAPGSLPEDDILDELLGCLADGSNVVVCANRGMLLRAIRRARANSKFHLLVEDLESIDQRSQEAAPAQGSKWLSRNGNPCPELRVWPLDHESVMFGPDTDNGWLHSESSLLDQIIIKATSEARWENAACTVCTVRSLCPMFNDAVWLREPMRRRSFLRFLRHSEVLSGQRMVLREALGIVSMVLVGAPSDFVDADQARHPCEWVHDRALRDRQTPNGLGGLLELLAHRIYMDLFGRQAPAGLTMEPHGAAPDDWILAALERSGSDVAGHAVAQARSVDDRFAKQAGPPRIASVDSIVQSLDPASDCSWCVAGGVDVDGTIQSLASAASSHQCGLEEELFAEYERISASIKALKPHADVSAALAALVRWVSGYYLRIVGSAVGDHALSRVLDDYLVLLATPNASLESTNREKRLSDLLRHAAAQGRAYQLTRDFVAEMAPQRILPEGARKRSDQPRWPANDRLALRLSPSVAVALTAATFTDIWLRHYRLMADWCMPPSLENLIQAWRDESVVLEKKYQGIPVIAFSGAQPLEFEVMPGVPVQVRKA